MSLEIAPGERIAAMLGFWTILTAGMVWLMYSNRRTSEGNLRKFYRIMGNWAYAFVIFACAGGAVIQEFFHQLTRGEIVAILVCSCAPLTVARFVVARHLRQTNAVR